jgi:hypothetical protein
VSRKANVQKSNWYRTIDAGSGAFSTHSEIDKKTHAFRRRILDHAFSDNALKSAQTSILENVRVWCQYLGSSGEGGPMRAEEWTPAKNMTEWSNYLSYDIMGDLTFGKSFGCVERDEHRYVPSLMMAATEFIYVVESLPSTQRKELASAKSDMLTNSRSSASFPSSPSSALLWAHQSWT